MATKVKLCKRDQDLIDSLEVGTKSETVVNPWSKDSCELEAQAVALYDYIQGAERLNWQKELRTGLTLFRKLYPNEYMVLLD